MSRLKAALLVMHSLRGQVVDWSASRLLNTNITMDAKLTT